MTYIYNETGDERIWEDKKRPNPLDYGQDQEFNPRYEKDLAAYNSRPSYPASDELKKKWVKGQRVDSKNFKPEKRCDFFSGAYHNICVFCKKEFAGTDKLWFVCQDCCNELVAIAIPLPEQSKPEEMNDEIKFTQEDMDLFAMAYCGWYSYAEDAQVYKQQNLSAYKMLQLYKDRPFLRTDSPEQN